MYGWAVMAWLVFDTANLDTQPTSIPFASMKACEKAAVELQKTYRYPIVCVKTTDD